MFVRHWMTSPAIVMMPDVPARAALAFLRLRNVRRLPVLERGRLVGIVTPCDLLRALDEAQDRDLHVGDVMTRRPVTVSPGDSLEYAATLMLDRRVTGLPVLDGERVVGVISRGDILRAYCWLARQPDRERRNSPQKWGSLPSDLRASGREPAAARLLEVSP